MSALLTLPIELDPDETIPYDEIAIYRRVNAYAYTLVDTVAIGTASYADADGKVGDEYHIRFRETATGVESLPSGIYRVLEPYHQRETEGIVVVVLELDTSSPITTVDYVAVYRRPLGEPTATRVALVAIGTPRWPDPDGKPGDIYHTTFVDTTNSTESQPSDYVTANAGSGLVVVSGRFEDLTGLRAESLEQDKNEDFRDVQVWLRKRSDTQNRTPTCRGQVLSVESAESKLDDSGRWSVVLAPNDLIAPAMTYYAFQYRGRQYFKRVHSQNGLVQDFALLPDVDPDVEGQRLLGRNF